MSEEEVKQCIEDDARRFEFFKQNEELKAIIKTLREENEALKRFVVFKPTHTYKGNEYEVMCPVQVRLDMHSRWILLVLYRNKDGDYFARSPKAIDATFTELK